MARTSCHGKSANAGLSNLLEPTEALVNLLETLAAQARRGEILGISYLTLSREGSYRNGTGGVFSPQASAAKASDCVN